MSDASDVQHHLEEGLLLFSRGMVFEARMSWRKALQLEPGNTVGLDYLTSSDCELNPYDRQREAEIEPDRENVVRVTASEDWGDDDYEVIAAGSAEEGGDAQSDAPKTGFFLTEDEEQEAASEASEASGELDAAGSWVDVSDEDTDWDLAARAEAEEQIEEVEAGEAEEQIEEVEAEEAEEDEETAEGIVIPPEEVPVAAGGEGETWEPLSWMGEDTPIAPPNGIDLGAVGGEALPAEEADEGESLEEEDLAGEAMASEENEEGNDGSDNLDQPASADSDEPPSADSDEPTSEDSAEACSDLSVEESPDDASEEGEADDDSEEELSIEALMSKAGEELLEGRREAARGMLLRVLELDPKHKQAKKYLKRVDQELAEYYDAVLGDGSGVPALNRPLAELFTLDLDPVGGYILSRIDGMLTLDDLFSLSAHIDPATLKRILVELIDSGVVSIRR